MVDSAMQFQLQKHSTPHVATKTKPGLAPAMVQETCNFPVREGACPGFVRASKLRTWFKEWGWLSPDNCISKTKWSSPEVQTRCRPRLETTSQDSMRK
jgi:hypothetical protein